MNRGDWALIVFAVVVGVLVALLFDSPSCLHEQARCYR